MPDGRAGGMLPEEYTLGEPVRNSGVERSAWIKQKVSKKIYNSVGSL